MKTGEWIKSSFSNGSGGNNCVEAYRSPAEDGVMIVRNSRYRGRTVTFTAAEWEAFVQGVKAGEFD